MRRFLCALTALAASAYCAAYAAEKPKKQGDNFYADVSRFANASLSDGAADLSKFPSNGKIISFGGMKFRSVDAEKNGGKSVLRISGGESFDIPVPKNPINGVFTMYILCNADFGGAKGSPTDKLMAGVFGKEGQALGVAYLSPGTAAGDISKATNDNSLSALVFSNDKRGKSGNVYLYSKRIPNSNQRGMPAFVRVKSLGKTAFNVYAITISKKHIDTTPDYDFSKESWKPIKMDDPFVEPGTVLDLAGAMGEKPAGKYGRTVVRGGHFEFENRPGARVKFKSTNWRPANLFSTSFADKAQIDKVVSNARSQGYNMIRWRLSHERLEHIVAPYKFADDIMDKYDYFLYACGREGVYTHLMISSHLFGDSSNTWAKRFDLKIRLLFGDPAVRAQWRRMAIDTLNHVNPYTGLAWKDDPSIATAEYFNELDTIYPFPGGILPDGAKYIDDYLRGRFKEKYGSIEKLNAAWGSKFGSFDEIKIYRNRENFILADKDISDILTERSRDLQKFFEKVVREEIGFKAPLHQHNCAMRMDVFRSSFEMGDYMAQNTYAAPQWGLMQPGGTCDQSDWISEEHFGHWFLYGVMKRVAGMPMAITEFQHRHWNPYKHEAGVFYPAYAAFHDYDMLTVHDVALNPNMKASPDNFSVYNSPVYRANEFLNFCLFVRGDVSPAKHRVEVEYNEDFMRGWKKAGHCMSFEQAKIAFLTGFSVAFTGLSKPMPKAKPADIVLQPDGCSGVVMFANRARDDYPGKLKISDAAKMLREKSILPPDNVSDPANGVFQTDTGEIVMRFKEGLVKVATPRTEAVSLKPETKNERAGGLLVKSVDVPAAVAITSMDGKSISKSARLVLVVNTDNISTGFRTSADRSILKDRGSLPVLVRTVKLSAEIALDPDRRFDVYALGMNGKRLQKLSFPCENGAMKIDLDTASLESGPSVFFEIAAR
ncbi:MAG: hypothetical protein IJI37_05690 [Opitutales bacterium]|nr:hypothetical protein [Opitutales bacterium]